MNSTGKAASLVYVLLLLACAFFAGYDTFWTGFAIGDGGGLVGFAAGALLIGTLVGGAGLAIASLGSWTGSRGVSLIALVSTLAVLPMAVLFGWGQARACWINSQLGFHYSVWEWTAYILPPFLGLAAAVWSWVRFRRFAVRLPESPVTR
jgi:hypothetical protein